MRCPSCGGLNHDQAAYCVSCGRTMQSVPPQRQQQPAQGTPSAKGSSTQPQARPASAPSNQPARPQQGHAPVPPRPTGQPVQSQTPPNRRQPVATGQVPVTRVPVPDAPGPFPPQTLEQFEVLLTAGAQPYTVKESFEGDGKKKYVRIAYANCTHWQQAGTLLQALRDCTEQFETIIIQGLNLQQQDSGAFNQGQLQFDRHVYLGSQVGNRYIVETGDGFKNDSVRFVLHM